MCSTCAKQKLSQPVEANDDDDDDNDNVVNNNTDRCMVIICMGYIMVCLPVRREGKGNRFNPR